MQSMIHIGEDAMSGLANVFEAALQGAHEPVRPEAEDERRREGGEEGDPPPGRPGQDPGHAQKITAPSKTRPGAAAG